MKLKYIIIEETFPILFHPAIKHDSICRGRKITSAGFCDIEYIDTDVEGSEITCMGKSQSLRVDSNPEFDKLLIERMIIEEDI